MRASLCRLPSLSPLQTSRQLARSEYWRTTPLSNLSTPCIAGNSTQPTWRHSSSKVPVYFSQENGTSPSSQRQLPSGRAIPPVYFANPGGHAPIPTSQPKSHSPKRSLWARAIAMGTLGCALYGFYDTARIVLPNREEVPFVNRIRYNLLPEEILLAETSPAAMAVKTGFPTLDTLVNSDLVVRPGEGQEIADLTHQIFDKLLADNGLSGIHLHILWEPNLRHAENQFSRHHIIIYSGILETCHTEALIAAHLAPIIASTVLRHREESTSYTMLIKERLVPYALLLLPTTVVYKLSAIVTVPVIAAIMGAWFTLPSTENILDDEADGLALDFMHNAGYDVMDYLEYRFSEAQTQDQLLGQYIVDGQISTAKAPAYQIVRDVQLAQKMKRRQDNTLNHLEERYQERLLRAEHEGQLIERKPESKPPKKS